MARYRVIYWKHIPSMVQVEGDGRIVRAQLSQRFQIAIDNYAMDHGLTGTTDYVAAWRHGDWIERPGAVEDVAQDVILELERQYSTKKLSMPVDVVMNAPGLDRHS
jgi:hypothetical protein